MKYTITNDIHNILKNNKVILIVSTLIFIFFSFYIKNFVIENEKMVYYLGITYNANYIMLLSLFVFDYIIYIYLLLKLYSDNLYMGYDYMFTRMKFNLWNKYKIISIALIVFVLKIFQALIYIIMGNYMINLIDCIYILSNSIITITLILLLIYLYCFRTKASILYTIGYLIILVYLVINWSLMSKWYINLSLFFILITISKILILKKSNDLKIKIGG